MESTFDPQAVLLELIQHNDFNHFSGKFIRDELVKYRNLWKACLMTRHGTGIVLRDLNEGCYNVDTLYILAAPGRAFDLAKVISRWEADEVKCMEGKEADSFLGQGGHLDETVFEVWWD